MQSDQNMAAKVLICGCNDKNVTRTIVLYDWHIVKHWLDQMDDSLRVRLIEFIGQFHMIYCKLANSFKIRMIGGYVHAWK
jgi:hypothetical protein